MVSRVEELKDTIAILKEEFGRRVYLDEVADYMHISEEEAEAILKLDRGRGSQGRCRIKFEKKD